MIATLGYRLRPTVAIELGAGAVLDGTLEPPGVAAADIGVGPAATAAISWLLLTETPGRPFVFLSASASVITVPTSTERLTALDGRVGVMVGKTFFARFTPYAAARAFAGPVFWTFDSAGGDVHHYTVGAGARLALPGNLDLFVEGMPLGEQSVNAGLGIGL